MRYPKDFQEYLVIGLTLGLGFAAILWYTEVRVLRGEVGRIAASRLHILEKRIDGKAVKEMLIPGTVTVVRGNDADYICGKVRLGEEHRKRAGKI